MKPKKLEAFVQASQMFPPDAWTELFPIRQKAGKILREVKKETGWSIQYLSDMEKGRRPLRMDVAEYYLKMARKQPREGEK